MNWLDIVIAVALAFTALVGLWLGFIKTLFSLAGIVVGIFIASHFYQELARLLSFIHNPNVADVVAFFILLLVVLVLAAIAAVALTAVLNMIRLGCVDRIAGAVLGLVFGALFVSAILAVIVKFFGPGPTKDSVLAGFLLNKFPIVLGLLPGEFSSIRDFFK